MRSPRSMTYLKRRFAKERKRFKKMPIVDLEFPFRDDRVSIRTMSGSSIVGSYDHHVFIERSFDEITKAIVDIAEAEE